jgi:hypothetical protein
VVIGNLLGIEIPVLSQQKERGDMYICVRGEGIGIYVLGERG